MIGLIRFRFVLMKIKNFPKDFEKKWRDCLALRLEI
jgi:hypothetical protein